MFCITHKKIHNQPDHQHLLQWVAFGNQQGQGHQCVVVNAGLIEQVVLIQKQQEEKGTDPLVTVDEGVILDDDEQKVAEAISETATNLSRFSTISKI